MMTSRDPWRRGGTRTVMMTCWLISGRSGAIRWVGAGSDLHKNKLETLFIPVDHPLILYHLEKHQPRVASSGQRV
jgi:hypothetical protein